MYFKQKNDLIDFNYTVKKTICVYKQFRNEILGYKFC